MAKDTVIVGCKLANGLVLQVGDKRVNLRGSAHYLQPNPKRRFESPELIYADSITLVDKEFWEAWLKQVGPEFGPLKSGAIYSSPNKAEATARAKDTESVRSGFEQLDPDKQPGIEKEGTPSQRSRFAPQGLTL